jgi:hypothetical protein
MGENLLIFFGPSFFIGRSAVNMAVKLRFKEVLL